MLPRWTRLVPVVGALTLALALAVPAAAKSPDANGIEGRYIVLFEPSVENVDVEVERQQRARGFRARHRYRHAVRGFAARLAPGQVRALRRDADVALVAPDRRVEALGAVPLAAGEPVPPTGIRRIGAATTSTARESADGAVAVIDTGIDLSHPDLNATHGTNCVTPTALADDDEGHGTHVAGTIAAKNDGAGVVGVAPGTQVYAVKVLDAEGSGAWSQVICGIDWVTANAHTRGIGVANMSLGGLAESDLTCGGAVDDPLHEAICQATDAGVLHVVAAGNDGWDLGDNPPDVPAAYPEVLTVTAMADSDGLPGGAGGTPSCTRQQADDAYASFSNYASRARDIAHMIAAPGVCIRSTVPGGGYDTYSGTSMASPHVAGAAALCLGEGGVPGVCAGMSPAEMVVRLRADAEAASTADPFYGFDGDPLRPNRWGDYFGYLAQVDRDRNPPETSITSGPPALTNATEAEFAFSADESPASFECSLDGGPWTSCSSPESYASLVDGAHTFSVRASDTAGNTDPSPATWDWTVDATAPDTSISSAPPARTADPTPTFEFASPDDAAATFECRVDSGAWTACSSPHTTGTLADGTRSFAVRARDTAGNVDASPATAAFTVDTQPPTVTMTVPGDGSVTNDSTPSLAGAAGTATGDDATVEVAVYAGADASGTPVQVHSAVPVSGAGWAVEASALGDGVYTARAEQFDDVGNHGLSSPVTFTVDTVAPDTSAVAGPSGATNDATPTFGFSSPDGGATFECSVDGGAWVACASPHTTDALADGAHDFEARAVDAAGNMDESPAAWTFTVDTVAPDTSISQSPPARTADATPTLEFVSPDDAAATFECRVDFGDWVDCDSPHTTDVLADGAHDFEARAVDAAGNGDDSPATVAFTVDTQAPTVTVTAPTDGSATSDSTPLLAGAAGTAMGDAATVSVAIHSGSEATGTPLQLHSVPVAGGAWGLTAAALGDGVYTAQAEQSDDVGNDGASAVVTFTVDTENPDTSVDDGPPDPTSDATPTFVLGSNETGVTFQCQLDAGGWEPCNPSHTTDSLPDGPHTLEALATDAAGNVDPTPASHTFTVDTAAPDTLIDSGPDAVTKSTTPTFEFSSPDDAGAVFECSIDSAPWTACESPHRTATLTEGDHTFAVRAVDVAGNADPTPAEHTFRIEPDEMARPPEASPSDEPAPSEEPASSDDGPPPSENPTGDGQTEPAPDGETDDQRPPADAPTGDSTETTAADPPAIVARPRGRPVRDGFRFRGFRLRAPDGTRVVARCSGDGCPPKPRLLRATASGGRVVNLRKLRGRTLAPGARLIVTVRPAEAPRVRFRYRVARDGELLSCRRDGAGKCRPRRAPAARVRLAGRATRSGFRVRRLHLRLPPQTRARVRCRGRSCPLRRRAVRSAETWERVVLREFRRVLLRRGTRLYVKAPRPGGHPQRVVYRVSADGDLMRCARRARRWCRPHA